MKCLISLKTSFSWSVWTIYWTICFLPKICWIYFLWGRGKHSLKSYVVLTFFFFLWFFFNSKLDSGLFFEWRLGKKREITHIWVWTDNSYQLPFYWVFEKNYFNWKNTKRNTWQSCPRHLGKLVSAIKHVPQFHISTLPS